MKSSLLRPDLSNLYEKNLIAFGTGYIGKWIIPYLAQIPRIRLYGVTNSRIAANAEQLFPGTGLPVRSLTRWLEQIPDAVVLVTATIKKDIEEISAVCRNAGVQEIILVDNPSIDAIEDIRPTGSPELQRLCLANEIRDTHKVSFPPFKACHKGQAVAVVGTGPTLNYYAQISGIRHIGVNASFLRRGLSLDYYFLFHYIPEWCEKLKSYDFVKFFAENRVFNAQDVFPECVIEEHNARRFFNGWPCRVIHTNIEYYPLMAFGSIIFAAIHFALYTRPKQILLIGCDCSADGYFSGKSSLRDISEIEIPLWLDGYQQLKAFVGQHYPDTEIVSVNPVGLKGMFHDVYTRGYLDAHPEIDRSRCEILDDEV